MTFASWTGGRAKALDVYGPAGVERVVAGFQAARQANSDERTIETF